MDPTAAVILSNAVRVVPSQADGRSHQQARRKPHPPTIHPSLRLGLVPLYSMQTLLPLLLAAQIKP